MQTSEITTCAFCWESLFGLRQLAELEEVSQRRMLEVPSGLAHLLSMEGI